MPSYMPAPDPSSGGWGAGGGFGGGRGFGQAGYSAIGPSGYPPGYSPTADTPAGMSQRQEEMGKAVDPYQRLKAMRSALTNQRLGMGQNYNTYTQDMLDSAWGGGGIGGSGSTSSSPNVSGFGGGKQFSSQGQAMFDRMMQGFASPPSVPQAPQTGTPAPATYAGVPQQTENAALDAAYARAKDTIGNTTRSALNANTDELRLRGLTGGGFEAGAIGRNLGGAAQQLGTVASDLAQRRYGAGVDVAKQQFAQAGAERGQNIGIAEANATRQQGQQMAQLQATQQRQRDLESALLGFTGQGFLTRPGPAY